MAGSSKSRSGAGPVDGRALHLSMTIMLCLAVLASTALPPAVAAGDKLAISYAQANAVYWNLDVAIERGFLRDEGFEPERIAMQSSPGSIQEAVGQSVQLAAASPEPLINAVERGAADLGILMAPTRKVDWTLNVRPEIKQISDLKGKRVGVSVIKGGEAWLTRELLEKAGLHRGEYTFLQAGISPLKLAALERGSIAAAVLLQPSGMLAEAGGFPALLTFTGMESYPYPIYAVSRGWAHEREHGVRLSRAIVNANRWLADRANRGDAVAILQKYTKQDPKLLDQTYEMFFVKDDIYVLDGKVDLAGLARLLKGMAADGDVKGDPDPRKYMIAAADGGLSN